MTLLARTSARANRRRQKSAEKRMDEIVSVAAIADDYGSVDRRGDLAIENHFQSLYHLVSSREEKEAVAAAYATWQKCERDEDEAVIRSVGGSVQLLKRNNDYWLNGSLTPDGSGDVA